jgi:hypothetical protein
MVAQNIGTLAKTIGSDEFVSSKLVRISKEFNFLF